MTTKTNTVFTKIVEAQPLNLARAAQAIKNGEVVAFPTETVYGLGANAFDEKAVKKIFEIKGRPCDNPLIVHISDKKQIAKVAKNVPKYAEALIKAFMPGALTLVLHKQDGISDLVTAGLDTVAVRFPKHPIAQRFILMCGVPLAAPSANSSTRPSPTEPSHVLDDLRGKISTIIDGGACQIGLESTVLDCTFAVPRLLRPGAVSLADIQKVVGEVEIAPPSDAPSSPGIKYKHYAPNCEVLFSAFHSKMCQFIITEYDARKQKGEKPIVFCTEKNLPHYGKRETVIMGKNNNEIAHNLFSLMRRFEKSHTCILVEGLSGEGLGDALINRLIKASGGKII